MRRQTPIRPKSIQLRSPRVVTVRAEESQEEDAPPAWVVDKLPETSAEDFRSMSSEQLLQAISDTKVQLFKLRVRNASRQEVNAGNFRKLKRKVKSGLQSPGRRRHHNSLAILCWRASSIGASE